MFDSTGNFYYGESLYHHGVKGMKWGVRRYQNPDGSLTAKGKKRYGSSDNFNAQYAYKNAKKDGNTISLKAAGHKTLAKVYGLNEKVYSKSNKTLSSMNKDAKEKQLKKAEEAQRVANEKAELTNKLKSVDPELAKNKATKRVAYDYHNLSDRQFAGKYKVGKKRFAKRYVKSKGDTYSMDKKKAALAMAFLASKPTHEIRIYGSPTGRKSIRVGRGEVGKIMATEAANTIIQRDIGYKKAEQKYKQNHR